MASESTKAVFLSYAREDTDVARRIADALRSHGVEVWFDQTELRGGDAWDQKIRRQIGDCTLFLPIISTNTQGRGKGYFRLEWKLAVEQTHLMAEGMSFLAPVVVDDTPESGALVPPEFMKVQWTRLPGALPTPQFVSQIRRLLDSPQKAAPADRGLEAGAGGPKAQARHAATADPTLRRPGHPAWIWVVASGLAIAAAAGILILHKPTAPTAPLRAELEPTPAATAPAAVLEKSIAVLPFTNFSPDKDNEFFADGLHDEVITALAKIHDLKVISRTSVMAYKSQDGRNLRKIAGELGVANVLEGGVQRVGNKVHLNVQLIDARTDEHLWADSYTRDVTDIFTVQSELAAAVTSALKATLSPEEKTLIVRRPTENQEAYDLYLRARIVDQSLIGLVSKADYERAISLYEQSEAKDPAFSLPHVQASILHGTMYWFAALDSTPERRAKAQAEMDAATRLAPGAPETLLAQGSFDYACRGDWAKALEEYRTAEALLPNDAQVQYRIAMAHRRLGQWAEAWTRLQRSAELNPNDYTELTQLIGTAVALRRYPQVLELIDRYRSVIPMNRGMRVQEEFSKLEIDGDWAEFVRKFPELPRAPVDPDGLRAAYELALLKGDLDAADHVLSDPRLTFVLNSDGSINDPVALHRAFVAFLQGRPDDARRFAEDAIASFHRLEWSPRQRPWVQLGLARAEEYEGHFDEAIRDGRAALDEGIRLDAFSSLEMRNEYGRILVLGGRRDDSFALLREMAGLPMPARTPSYIRHDVVWERLKDDPRFGEIIASMKAL
jgi:TolB-like protein